MNAFKSDSDIDLTVKLKPEMQSSLSLYTFIANILDGLNLNLFA